MIVQEHYELNGIEFTRTFSDAGKCVTRDGEEYEEANDPTEYGRVYTESENDLPSISAEEALDIITGVVE